jgi:hypothetical protein
MSCCVPETVGINRKGVNKNDIPIKRRHINRNKPAKGRIINKMCKLVRSVKAKNVK